MLAQVPVRTPEPQFRLGRADATIVDAQELFLEHGAVLLRCETSLDPAEFGDLVSCLFPHDEFAPYREAASPRTPLTDAVYTSTEYDPSGGIFFHQENAQCLEWPERIHFHCVQPAQEGGATPIVDLEGLTTELDQTFVERIRNEGICYVRNFSPQVGMSPSRVFGSEDPDDIDAYCQANAMSAEWLGPKHLRVRFHRPAFRAERASGREVWFNHIAFYSPFSLDSRTGRALRLIPERLRPFQVAYADGSEIEAEHLAELCEALRRRAARFDWRAGDVLCLDNLRYAHGRDPFSGPRQVMVAMTASLS